MQPRCSSHCLIQAIPLEDDSKWHPFIGLLAASAACCMCGNKKKQDQRLKTHKCCSETSGLRDLHQLFGIHVALFQVTPGPEVDGQ